MIILSVLLVLLGIPTIAVAKVAAAIAYRLSGDDNFGLASFLFLVVVLLTGAAIVAAHPHLRSDDSLMSPWVGLPLLYCVVAAAISAILVVFSVASAAWNSALAAIRGE